ILRIRRGRCVRGGKRRQFPQKESTDPARPGVVFACSGGLIRQSSRGSNRMSHTNGLGRRSFLRNAGMTALVGAVGSGTPFAAAAAEAAVAATNGKFDFDTPYNRFGTDSTKY